MTFHKGKVEFGESHFGVTTDGWPLSTPPFDDDSGLRTTWADVTLPSGFTSNDDYVVLPSVTGPDVGGTDGQVRYKVEVISQTATTFRLQFTTWSKSNIFGVTVEYLLLKD